MKWHETYVEKEFFTKYSAKKNKHYLQIDKGDDKDTYLLCVTAMSGKAVWETHEDLETAKKSGEKIATKGIE